MNRWPTASGVSRLSGLQAHWLLSALAIGCITVSAQIASAQIDGIFSPPPVAARYDPMADFSGPGRPEGGFVGPDGTTDQEPNDVDLPQPAHEPGGRTIRRRTAIIDLDRVAEAGRRAAEGEGDASFHLNLFANAGFTAVDLRTARTWSGYSIAGHLAGVRFGTLTLVVNGNVVRGTVRTVGSTFTIRSVGSVVDIREVDESILPPGAEPIIPPPSTLRDGPMQTDADEDEQAGMEKVVDVLVIYTPDAREAEGGREEIEATIDLWLAETNKAFADSGVDGEVALADSREVAYTATDLFEALDSLADHGDGTLDDVHEIRDLRGADLVSLIVANDDGSACGVAFLLSSTPSALSAFSVSALNCGARTFAHELGHNMGLLHDRYVDAEATYKTDPRAHGYVNREAFKPEATPDQRWRTIMAYPDQCSVAGFSCGTPMRFSNPDLSYQGDPVGVTGSAETWATDGPADARHTLNATRGTVVAWRRSVPLLEVAASIPDPELRPGGSFTFRSELRNRGREGIGAVGVSIHRSADATVVPGDEEVGFVEFDEVAPSSTRVESTLLTAPDTRGSFWFGACLSSDKARSGRECSESVPVAVGPNVAVNNAPSAREGDALEFRVSLSEPISDTAVSVQWRAIGDTAVELQDFPASSGTLTIPAGETEATIVVPTVADNLAEPDDDVTVSLVGVSPSDVPLNPTASSAVGTILDDKSKLTIPDPALRIALAHALGKEAGELITADDLAGLTELDWTAGVRASLFEHWSEHGITDLTGLQFATNLRRMDLFDNDVDGLSVLGHLTDLRFLKLGGEISVTDLTPLAGLSELRELQLSHGDIRDISPLAGLVKLQVLRLHYNEISDVSVLRGLADLRDLFLSGNPIADISPLADFGSLTRLALERAQVSDVTPLADLGSLNYLNLARNAIADVTPLGHSLFARDGRGTLILADNAFTDISDLADFANVTNLDLSGNGISEIAPLAGLVRLTSLSLADNEISEIAPLAGLVRLTSLNLAGNEISDLRPLASLEGLTWLYLEDNAITDIEPLAGLGKLVALDLSDNRIFDISPLSGIETLQTLQLRGNAVTDIDPLASVTGLVDLDLSGNRVIDISPLSSLTSLRTVHVLGNPLGGEPADTHVTNLRLAGVDVFNNALWVGDGSAKEGDGAAFRFPVYLSVPVSETIDGIVVWFFYRDQWRGFTDLEPTAAYADTFDLIQLQATIPAHADAAVAIGGRATEDKVDEEHETFIVQLRDIHLTELPVGVGYAELFRGLRHSTAVGLIVDPHGPAIDVPLFPTASDTRRQGFARVINRGGRSAAHVEAFDTTGTDHGAVTLALRPGRTVHLNSDDLLEGNREKAVHGSVGADPADGGEWRLRFWLNDSDVLAYVRTPDGFLSSLHDTVPRTVEGTHYVPIFNPGSNRDQVSLLRIANSGAESASLTITGTDDTGMSPGSSVQLVLDGGASRTLTSVDLEGGAAGLHGSLGDGHGKWRLDVVSDRPIVVASLLESPTGHLTNLSTVPDNGRAGEGDETVYDVPIFLAAADSHGRQGFVRVVNRGSEDAVLRVRAYDETEREYEPIELAVAAGSAAHFNSHDLEQGNVDKGLSGSIGAGEGDWRLELFGGADVDVLAFLRTDDGFLSSVHDVVSGKHGRYEVPIFNPGSNRNQVSILRLVNPHEQDALVSVRGIDDWGVPRGIVEVAVPAGAARTFDAQELENGGEGFAGALGDGIGKWRLAVESSHPVHVMSLLEGPTGHLTNLSTTP